MKTVPLFVLILVPLNLFGQSPEDAASAYFEAISRSDKEQLIKIADEASATRIGKSIIAASPMFHRKEVDEFFELIFDRVPTPAEIEAMTPLQAFAEYMCEPLDPRDVTTRTILGAISEDDSLAHVVYRVNGTPSLAEKERDVLTCVRHDGEWRVIISSRVWEAYMNFMLRPAMARLSGEKADTEN